MLGSAGIPGLPVVLKGPVRSRLIDNSHDSMMSQYTRSSPKHIHAAGRRQAADSVDRWDSTKSPEGRGAWKTHKPQGTNGVTSPDSNQKGFMQRSRWVKMEEEDSWRKNGGDDQTREPRYAWKEGASHQGRAEHYEDAPEWADVNPHQKIQMTADVIEAERLKMQATWRKELEEKKAQHPDMYQEVGEDEIEKWKKEQEEQDVAPGPGSSAIETATQERVPVNRNDIGPAKGRQVDLQHLFGSTKNVAPSPAASAQPPPISQDLATQFSQTYIGVGPRGGVPPPGMHTDQGKNLLAMLHAGARPPPHPTSIPPVSQGRMAMMPPPPGPGGPQYTGMPIPHPGMFPPNMMPRPPPPHMSGLPVHQNQNPPGTTISHPQSFGGVPGVQPVMVRPGQQINVAALFGGHGGAGRPTMPQHQHPQGQPSLAEIVGHSPSSSQMSL